jgi:hypothetical protein
MEITFKIDYYLKNKNRELFKIFLKLKNSVLSMNTFSKRKNTSFLLASLGVKVNVLLFKKSKFQRL